MAKRKNKRIKYNTGGAVSNTSSINPSNVPYGMLANAGAGLITAASKDGPNAGRDAGVGALKGASTGASIGSIIPGVGTAVGAGVGAVIGGATGYLKGKKEEDALAEEQHNQLMMMASNPANSGVRTLGQTFEYGGRLQYQNGGQLTEYNGLEHSQGGLPLGDFAEVEDGETRYNDNIFSNSIQYDKKKTFADASKDINKKYSLRNNDKFSNDSKELELNDLFNQQELFKLGGNLKGNYKMGGRIKYFDGGSINKSFDPPKDIETFIKLATINPKMAKSTGIDPTKLKGYDPEKHQNLVLGYTEGLEYKRQPAAKKLKYYNDEQQKKFIRRSLKAGNKEEAMRWRPDLFKEVVKEFPEYNETLTQNTIAELPTVEVEADKIKKAGMVKQSEVAPLPVKELDPIGPDYAGMAGSIVPGALGAIGNLALANQVDYARLSPDQVRLQHVDPTRASQEIRGSYAGANEGIRQNARGIGSFMSNRLASAAGESRGLSGVYADYDNRNVGIDNQERLVNFNARNRANEFNTNIINQETQDRIGYRAKAMSAGIQGIDRGIRYGIDDKRFRQTLPLMSETHNVGYDPETGTYQKYLDKDNVYRLRGSNTQPSTQQTPQATSRVGSGPISPGYNQGSNETQIANPTSIMPDNYLNTDYNMFDTNYASPFTSQQQLQGNSDYGFNGYKNGGRLQYLKNRY